VVGRRRKQSIPRDLRDWIEQQVEESFNATLRSEGAERDRAYGRLIFLSTLGADPVHKEAAGAIINDLYRGIPPTGPEVMRSAAETKAEWEAKLSAR
jgi:hypothetical protein